MPSAGTGIRNRCTALRAPSHRSGWAPGLSARRSRAAVPRPAANSPPFLQRGWPRRRVPMKARGRTRNGRCGWLADRLPVSGRHFRELTNEPVPYHLKRWWFALGGTPAAHASQGYRQPEPAQQSRSEDRVPRQTHEALHLVKGQCVTGGRDPAPLEPRRLAPAPRAFSKICTRCP